MRYFLKPLVLLLLAGSIYAQHPVPVEVHAPRGLAVKVVQDKREQGITKYVITRSRSSRPIILTTRLLDSGGYILHTHTDRMGRRAEVAWATQAEVRRLVVVVERR